MVTPNPAAAAHRYPWRIILCLLLLAYGPMFLWLCLPITGLGGWSTQGIELFALLPMIGLCQVVLSWPLFLFGRTRERAVVWLQTGAWLVLGFLPLLWLGSMVRMRAFALAGERAMPLVAAIERYVAANGEPPNTLGELVPRWLDRLPQRVPPLDLAVGDRRSGNAWMLSASVPTGLVNFDRFMYLPNQDYDGRSWGGSFQRLGRWAYLHE